MADPRDLDELWAQATAGTMGRSGLPLPPPSPATKAVFFIAIRSALDLLKRSDPDRLLAAVWKLEADCDRLLLESLRETASSLTSADIAAMSGRAPGDGASAPGGRGKGV